MNPQIVRGTTGSFVTHGGTTFYNSFLYPAGSWNGTTLAAGSTAFDTYNSNPGSSADGWGVSVNLSTGLTAITVPLTAPLGTNYTIGMAIDGSPVFYPFDVVAPPSPRRRVACWDH